MLRELFEPHILFGQLAIRVILDLEISQLALVVTHIGYITLEISKLVVNYNLYHNRNITTSAESIKLDHIGNITTSGESH